MYLRFETKELDKRSGKMKGIFTLSYQLIENNELSDIDEMKIKNILSWFSKYLPVPDKFSKKKNDAHKNHHGISWMKSDAKEAIEYFWKLKIILDNVGHNIEVLKVKNPGKVVYEDNFQLVAEPYGKKI